VVGKHIVGVLVFADLMVGQSPMRGGKKGKESDETPSDRVPFPVAGRKGGGISSVPLIAGGPQGKGKNRENTPQ